MNIRQAKEEIINTIRAYGRRDRNGDPLIPIHRQRPLLIMGPPGIGKTRIMEQIASEMGIGLASYSLTHHTRQSALGLPAIVDKEYNGMRYRATEYTMSEILDGIYDVMRDQGHSEGILFLDEINCVSETLMPAMLQLLQQKTFGGRPVPEGWIITAAGNPPEYNRLARSFDVVTLDRVRLIETEPDMEVWMQYGENAGIDPSVMSFLRIKDKYFFRMSHDVDGVRYVTPRGWEDLSSLIKAYEAQEIPVSEDVIREFIRDDEAALDFAEYYEMFGRYRDDYHVDDILAGCAPASVYERLLKAPLDERLSLVRLMLDGMRQAFVSDAGPVLDAANTADAVHAVDAANTEDAVHIADAVHPDGVVRTADAGTLLKNAISFIDEAMGNGPEMILFLTGISDNTEAVMYLILNPVEEYTRYSEELLGDKRRAQLLSRLQ